MLMVTPHESNGRSQIDDNDNDFWFGFEQEYFIMDVDTQLAPRISVRRIPRATRDCIIVPLEEKILTGDHL